jgi:hypothetical protein
MIKKLADALVSLMQVGPYAPLTADETVRFSTLLALYSHEEKTREAFQTRYLARYACGLSRLALAPPVKKEPIIVRQYIEDLSVKSSLALYEEKKGIAEASHIYSALSDSKLSFLDVRETILLNLDICTEAISTSSYRALDQLHPRVRPQVPLTDTDAYTFATVAIELLRLSLCVNKDEHMHSSVVRSIQNLEKERSLAIDSKPHILLSSSLLNHYLKDYLSSSSIAGRREAELKKAREEEHKAEQERLAKEKAVEEQRRFVRLVINADHISSSRGVIELEAEGFAPAAFFEETLSESELSQMRQNIARKLILLLEDNPSFRCRYDDFTATRPFRSMPAEARIIAVWNYLMIKSGFFTKEDFDRAMVEYVRSTFFSCLIYDDRQYITSYNTKTQGIWAIQERDAVLDAIIKARLKPPALTYGRALEAIKTHTVEPGPWGELARMMVGESGGTGWATER